MTQPSFTQVTFRLRNDNGSETTATWRQTQGTDDTLVTDTNYRCRFLIDETAARTWTNKVWNLYYSLNGGAYAAAASGQPVKLSLSGNFAQDDDCTSQLTGGSGTFVTDNNGMCESSGSTNSGAAGQYFEVEYCFQIDSAYVANGNTIVLRVYDGSTAIAAYTDSPSITVSEPPAPTTITMDTALLTLQSPAIDLQQGAVSIILATALQSVAGVHATIEVAGPSQNINFSTSVLTTFAVSLSVVEGTATIPLNTSTLSLVGVIASVNIGSAEPVTIMLDTSTLTLTFDTSITLLYQTLNPVQDTSLGGWTDQAGGTTNIFQSIDEEVPDDADYVKSPVLPAANTYKFKLENGGDPDIHLHHSITLRFRKPFDVGTTTIAIRLMEDSTQRATWTESVTTSWTTVTKELSEAEAASIVDYTHLYIELEAA